MRRGVAILLVVLAGGVARAAPSLKRGVCAQHLSAEDFRALAPGVSWWYNWALTPDAEVPAGGPEFVPMLWGDSQGFWKRLDRSLAARPRLILGLNEPNLKAQANLTPQDAARAYARLAKAAARRGIPVVGPQLALGSAPADTVHARDPKSGRDIAYPWMVPYLEAFSAALPGGKPTALAVHVYGNVGELKWAVGELAKRSAGPIWVTEFNEWKAADEDAQIAYMKEAVAFLEASPDVAGYAWFMARIKDDRTRSLLAAEPGRLTRLGETYVGLPAGKPASPRTP